MCMLVLYAEFTSNDKQGSSQQPQMASGSGIDDGKILIGWDQLLNVYTHLVCRVYQQ